MRKHTTLPPAASFNLFEPAPEAEITTLIHASQNKQCDLDPIPTSLLKECADLLVPTITNIVVKPLLRKPSLDKELLSNYRPISNPSFLSKLSEQVVLSRLKGYLTSNNLLNPNQSAYTKHHSTETLLNSLYHKLVMAIGHQQVSCLCLIDISATFDTIDHTILTHRLIDHTILTHRLYLESLEPPYHGSSRRPTSRSFTVNIAGHTSNPQTLTCGVPQGFVHSLHRPTQQTNFLIL